jgi:hypothetical protein
MKHKTASQPEAVHSSFHRPPAANGAYHLMSETLKTWRFDQR